jgi:hypothetical protein
MAASLYSACSAKSNGGYRVRYIMLKNSQTPASAPTLQDATDPVVSLASRPANILVEGPGSNGAYQLAMSITTACKRLQALERFVDDPANTPTLGVVVHPGGQAP